MRARCSVFIAASLDGFIARGDGRIDWLDAANAAVPEGEDCGFAAFMASVDALVMGRLTFETVMGFPEWYYGDKPIVVLSGGMRALPEGAPATVSLSSESPEALVARLTAQGMRHLYVDGGVTIRRFLAAGLIDEVIITWIPVLIGEGRPLFGGTSPDVRLEHVSTHAYPFGFVQTRYRVVGAAPGAAEANAGGTVEVRRERPDDAEAVARVNAEAFGRPDEARLVEALRAAGGARLSLVAVVGGEVVGHALFTDVDIDSPGPRVPARGLGPMAVLPAHQRRGIGSRLVEAGLAACDQEGCAAVVVIGHPAFYPRFGFRPARALGLETDFPVPDDVFLVRERVPGALQGRSGRVRYRPEFGGA